MNNKIKIQNENGVWNTYDILTILKIDDFKYIVYSLDTSVSNCDVFVSKIVKDKDGIDMIVNIDSKLEKEKVFDVVFRMINDGVGVK